jgi:hypothetical protein
MVKRMLFSFIESDTIGSTAADEEWISGCRGQRGATLRV